MQGGVRIKSGALRGLSNEVAPRRRYNIKRCRNAKLYKATRFPTCNGGNPCLACLVKWQAKLADDKNGWKTTRAYCS